MLRCFAFTLMLGTAACLPSIDDLDWGPLSQSFAVSDYFTPSGFMGDGANFGHLYMDVNTSCKTPRPPNAAGNCYTFTYYKDTSPTAVDWAGVYWVFPANNWGTRSGHAIDFTKFQQIRYSVSVDYPPIPADVQAMGVLPQPPNVFYGGIAHFTNEDTVSGKIFPPISSELKRYFLPFPDGQAVTAQGSLIGAFGWSIAFPFGADPAAPLVIHLDDIVWDTAAPPASESP
jgi:hypothetical protein